MRCSLLYCYFVAVLLLLLFIGQDGYSSSVNAGSERDNNAYNIAYPNKGSNIGSNIGNTQLLRGGGGGETVAADGNLHHTDFPLDFHGLHESLAAEEDSRLLLMTDSSQISSSSSSSGSIDNSIVRENRLKGSKGWWAPQQQSNWGTTGTGTGTGTGNNANGSGETMYEALVGYTTSFSYLPGDTVKFKIHARSELCNPGNRNEKEFLNIDVIKGVVVTVDVYRLGYYGGDGGRLVGTTTLLADKKDAGGSKDKGNSNSGVSGVSCPSQPSCMFDSSSRMVDCGNWRVNANWKIPPGMVTGIYVALPKANGKFYGNYMPFVVRNAKGKGFGSDLLFKTADTTWVAYNKYGGWNVYRGNGSFQFDSRAFKASYNRPFSNRLIKPWGQHENFLFGSEFPQLYWLEKHGYDVSYASSFDVEEYDRMQLLTPKYFNVLLSVGHDEYWTQDMKDAFVKARNAGMNLGFLSGNELFWKVRWSRMRIGVDDSANSVVFRNVYNDRFYQMKTSANDDAVSDEEEPPPLSSAARSEPPRVIVCYKETIDVGSSSGSGSSSSSIHSSAAATAKRTAKGAGAVVGGGDVELNGNKGQNKIDKWTGTFMDPRVTGFSDAQNSLTGQLFMVNGFQNDTIEARIDDLKLRFWRNTSASSSGTTHNNIHHHHHSRAYVSPHGILGYEWDIFVDDCARPLGMIGMSTTHRYIKRGLLETYGATYLGNGSVTHRLTLYRHTHSIHSSIYNKTHYVSTVSPLGALDIIPIDNAPTSLVFSTGTIQWSWGLSSWHDGHDVVEDLSIKQATMNILGDMRALPFRPSLDKTGLVFPTAALDNLPPVSMITFPAEGSFFNFTGHHRHKSGQGGGGGRGVIRVRGSSIDRGGGVVAAVEVSIDRGKSWTYAHLIDNEKWFLQINVASPAKVCEDKALAVGEGDGEEGDSSVGDSSGVIDFMVEDEVTHVKRWMVRRKISVWSRAVDDSGWIEGCCDALGGEVEKERNVLNKVNIEVVY